MKGKVLLLGGAGFIGSHTADLLAKEGYSIRIMSSLCPPTHDGSWPEYLLHKNYELVLGDVTIKEDMIKVLEGVDYVFHFAAFIDQLPQFSTFFETNTVSVALLYELILEKKLPVKKIIYASSQFVYGDGIYRTKDGMEFFPNLRDLENFNQKIWNFSDKGGKEVDFIPFKEDQKLNPTNCYGISKIAGEQITLKLGKTYGIPSTVVRYSIVQGSRQSPLNFYSGALRIFVCQALAGQTITVTEDGNQLRDFVNVTDVARANLLILENSRTDFEIFNVGGGVGYKIKDFAQMVKKITHSTSEILIDGRFRRSDTRNAVSDITKLTSFGWSPKNTPEQSIKEYVDWIKASKYDILDLANKIKEGAKKLV